METVSVITPYYYGDKYLKKLCDMIEINHTNASQVVKIEFVIVNDSPEEKVNMQIMKNYKFEYQIINNEVNSGIQQARINGLKKAKGDYIMFLDQDDEISDNCIISQYSKIKGNDVIISNGYFKKNGKLQPMYHNRNEHRNATILKKYKYEAQIISPGLCLIKKDAIPQYWCDNILANLGTDDYFLWIIMLYKEKKFTINQEKLFYYNLSDNNYSKNKERMKKSALEACKLIEAYDEKLYTIITKSFRKMQTVNYHKDETLLRNGLNLILNMPIVLYKIYRNIVKIFYKILYKF